MISKHIKNALYLRFPGSDFGDYFAFLDTRPLLTDDMPGTEIHHIIPRSVPQKYRQTFLRVSTLDPDNMIVLSTKDHDMAHRLLGDAEPWLLRTALRANGFYN